MPKVSEAGVRVLRAFDRRPSDVFEYRTMSLRELAARSDTWRHAHRVLPPLIRAGLLASELSHSGERYLRTKAGVQFLKESRS